MMPPRPRGPFQGPPMGGRMQGMRGPTNLPGGAMGRGGTPGRGSGGGLLSKIFGGGNSAASGAANAGARSAASGGGGLLKTLTNPSSINGFLANSQKFLNTASQLGPMINQYGPMVKNIPAMWKLYRGLKSSTPETEEAAVTEETTVPVKSEKTSKAATKKKQPKAIEDDFEMDSEKPTGAPKPKLYV
ncbi:VrrA/YqfQ family protein [Niallia sp.]|uniref:VrrA/YqfQ family protein n=1 Tax=Niallia sp. TaxID=2837523 RepID=UPI00289BA5C2|nr:VrrA/YqfQ family protein [Niallia sp.]